MTASDQAVHTATAATPLSNVLEVRGLRVELDSGLPVVDGVDLHLRAGEILGIVGESGSGKTTTALALLGYCTPGTRIAAGTVDVGGRSLLELDETGRRRLRGRVISYVPQDAGQALNPALRIRQSITDVIRQHRAEGPDDVSELLAAVDLDVTAGIAERLPHQLSGGQQQRVTIAMALSCDAPVVIMDEPTTGLDVITQATVLAEIRRLRAELGAAMVYVSHDLAVVSQLADRVAVMYAGAVVEQGPTADLLRTPRHPYTRGLVRTIPDHRRPARPEPLRGTAVGVEDRPAGCSFAPRCDQVTAACSDQVPPLLTVGGPAGSARSVRCLHHDRTPGLDFVAARARDHHEGRRVLQVEALYASHRGADTVTAASDVSFDLIAGECLALVGQSGSGKTTIARCLAGLHRPDSGTIRLDGEPLPPQIRRRTVEQRRRVQYVFQNPFQSLNPRRTVADQLARPAQVLRGLDRRSARREVPTLLDQVRLPARVGDRVPHQLSGGERQRVAVARALAARPDVLICDEVTSALDVSVQAAVLDVLAELQRELQLAILLITHDLGVVSVAADRVVVLERGCVREAGPLAAVMADPTHEYTRRLLAAAPSLLTPIAAEEQR